MRESGLSIPPPKPGRLVLIIGLLVAIAGGTGVITWSVVSSKPPPSPQPQSRPRVATSALIVDPEPVATDEEINVKTAAGTSKSKAAPTPTSKARPKQNKQNNPDNQKYPSFPTGTIDARRVSAFIRSKQSEVRRCYERRLKHNNFLQGVLDTQIHIHPSGRVMSVSFSQDTLHDPVVNSCVSRVVKKWQFPSPTGGAVKISNPFRFEPRLQ